MINKDLKILCIVQARTTSTRLPNKVLLNLGGKSVIEQIFHQLKFSKYINKCVLATSTDTSDDKLEIWANANKIDCFRGSLDDVLSRYYYAAKAYNGDIIVRVTGDCPLIDPEIVDDTIKYFLDNNFEYVSNANPPTFPDGLDTEVFKFKVLEIAWQKAKLQSEREHVTSYIRNNKKYFKIGSYKNKINLNNYRWTLDNIEDYILISEIYRNLKDKNSFIKFNDVLEFLEKNPELINLNKHIKRNEGFKKSILNDKKIKNKNG